MIYIQIYKKHYLFKLLVLKGRVEKGGNGKETETTFYILPSGWKEICGTSDSVKTARLCDEAGWIKKDDDGRRLQCTVRLPEIGAKKVYVFNGGVIG